MNQNNNQNFPIKNQKMKRAPHKRKASPVKIVLIVLLTLILSAFLILGCIFLRGWFGKPTASGDTSIPFELPESLHLNPNDTTDTGNDGPKQPVDPKVKEGCYNFLLIAHDKVGLNTDVIMILSFDVNTHKINVVQIPRDTYTEVNGHANKINALYGIYYNNATAANKKNPSAVALEELSSTLEKNLNIKIHYYAKLNLEGFRNIVDIIGGVEIDVPADMKWNDPAQDLYIDLKKGKQLLDGKKAEQFVRFRMGYAMGDLGRMDAQKIFLSEMAKKIKDSFNISTVVQLASEAIKNVETSLPVTDCIYFAKQFMSVNMNEIGFLTMPGRPVTSGYSYYIMNRADMRDTVNKYLNVYNFEITEEMFDKNRFFTAKNNAPISAAYNRDSEASDPKTADDIVKDGIYLPRVY